MVKTRSTITGLHEARRFVRDGEPVVAIEVTDVVCTVRGARCGYGRCRSR